MSKILATPKARAMAKQANIDLADLKIQGRKIEASDVENYIKSLKSAQTSAEKVEVSSSQAEKTSIPAPIPPKLEGKREKIAPIRKAIARAMTNS